jgi:hypothetical protein
MWSFKGFLKGPREIEGDSLVLLVGASQIQDQNYVLYKFHNDRTTSTRFNNIQIQQDAHHNANQESGADEGYFCKFFQFLLMASKQEIPKFYNGSMVPWEKTSVFSKEPWSRHKTFRISRLSIRKWKTLQK